MIRPVWLLVLVLAGCQPVKAVDVSPFNETDQIQWGGPPSAPVLTVTSPGGIGGATLTKAADAAWPDSLMVELHLDALEGFVLQTETEHYRLEVTGGDVLTEPANQRVLHMNSFAAIKEGKKFNLSIQLRQLAEPATEIRLEWVDYYR